MSTIIVVKEGSELVMGTDSRYVSPDKTRIVSDSVEKIREIGPETFLATSGYAMACDFQNAKASELGQGTADIRQIASALERASRPVLDKLVGVLTAITHLHPQIAETVAGANTLHGAVLIGRSRGRLGYIVLESQCSGDHVVTKSSEYFGTPRQVYITSSAAANLTSFRSDWRIWTDPPICVVNRILDAQKGASNLIGGPPQIVLIDNNGAHWVRRLPRETRQATCPETALAMATISAAITMTSPTLVISGAGGAFTVNIDDVNGVKVISSTTGYTVSLKDGSVKVTDASGNIGYMDAGTTDNIGGGGHNYSARMMANSLYAGFYLTPVPLPSSGVPNGSLAISDGTGGYTAGHLYFRQGNAWVAIS